jgi:ABC-2 type transport system ATP-binding protein
MIQTFDEPLAIETRGVHKRFRNNDALTGLDLSVPAGAVYLLVGPNGAGKTTTLRLLIDLLRPDAGDLHVFGLQSGKDGAHIRAGVGYVPEGREPAYEWMAVRELIAHHARYFAGWDESYAAQLVGALDVRLDDRFGVLSKGEVRRVQLVMALAHRPRLLLLDEPTDGLDPVIRDRFFALLADHLAASETTVLISSHLVYESETFADHLGVMKSGRLTAQLARPQLDEQLLRYVVDVPAEWDGPGSGVLARKDGRSECDLVMWGNETAVRETLQSTGASVRASTRVTLTEAARLLMENGEVAA